MRRLVAVPVVLLVVTLGVGAMRGVDDAPAPESTQGRVCVSAEVWSGDDAERPCARIVRVWEDGSTQVRVTRADGGEAFTATTGARR